MASSISLLLLIFALTNSALSLCPVPNCNSSSASNVDEPLYPHSDPYKFWQCAPSTNGLWSPVEKDCAVGGTVFSYAEQACVWLNEWDQTCQNYPETTTVNAPTTTSTSTSTSEPSTTESTSTVEPSNVNCCSALDCTISDVALLPDCPFTNIRYREFYRECVNGQEIRKHCPHKPGAEQLVFNYFIQSCVHPTKFEEACPSGLF